MKTNESVGNTDQLYVSFHFPHSALRPATGGRPGDLNSARPDRWERRFRSFIATPFVKVLRRPLETVQYVSMKYTERLAEASLVPSVGSVGDSYDNALLAYAGMVGYRALDVDYEQGSGRRTYGYDILQHGPVLGLAIGF